MKLPIRRRCFLAQRQEHVAGSAVLAGLEGTRPVLVEVQALVAPSALGNPRRAVIGWDSNRLAMVLAVLEARCGMTLSDCDIFLNIAGGIRISEPGGGFGRWAAALISSQTGKPVQGNTVFFGEVGLSGEIRTVAQPDVRMGTTIAFFPEAIRVVEYYNYSMVSCKTYSGADPEGGIWGFIPPQFFGSENY